MKLTVESILLANRKEKYYSFLEIVLWWEIRRIPYNLLLITTGILNWFLCYWFMTLAKELQPGDDVVEPIALFAGFFFANIFYCLGWITEVIYKLIWRKDSNRIGSFLFKLGLIFTLFISFIPSNLWFLTWIIRTLIFPNFWKFN